MKTGTITNYRKDRITIEDDKHIYYFFKHKIDRPRIAKGKI